MDRQQLKELTRQALQEADPQEALMSLVFIPYLASLGLTPPYHVPPGTADYINTITAEVVEEMFPRTIH